MQAVTLNIDEENRPGLPFRLASSGHYQMHMAGPGQERYSRACALSVAEYKQHFQCDLRHFYPSYLCLERAGTLVAVCGYQSARDPLFLEQYLDAPIEALISRCVATDVPRAHIVEIGGFAVKRRAFALPFISALAPVFRQKGFSHASCTATHSVRRCLRRLSIPTLHLAKADPERLRLGVTDWGNYYQQRPVVIAGSIDHALQRLQESFQA